MAYKHANKQALGLVSLATVNPQASSIMCIAGEIQPITPWFTILANRLALISDLDVQKKKIMISIADKHMLKIF